MQATGNTIFQRLKGIPRMMMKQSSRVTLKKKKIHIRTGGERSQRKYLRNYMTFVTICKTVYQKYFIR